MAVKQKTTKREESEPEKLWRLLRIATRERLSFPKKISVSEYKKFIKEEQLPYARDRLKKAKDDLEKIKKLPPDAVIKEVRINGWTAEEREDRIRDIRSEAMKKLANGETLPDSFTDDMMKLFFK